MTDEDIELPNGISEGLKQAMEDYNRLDTEAMRYLANGSDYFEIQAGAWTLKFDSTHNESQNKHKGMK